MSATAEQVWPVSCSFGPVHSDAATVNTVVDVGISGSAVSLMVLCAVQELLSSRQVIRKISENRKTRDFHFNFSFQQNSEDW